MQAMEAAMPALAIEDATKLPQHHETQLVAATRRKSALIMAAPGSGLEIHSHKYAGRKRL